MALEADLSRNTKGSNFMPCNGIDDEVNLYSKDKSEEKHPCPSTASISNSSGLRAEEKTSHL